MTKYIIVSLLTIYSLTAFAQGEDQVITTKGETLTGKVTISTFNSSAQVVTLKNGKDKKHFKVYEVKEVTKGGDVYYTLKIHGKYQLGLLKKEGYLSLYQHVSSEPNASNEFSESIFIKKDGAQLSVPNLGFKKQLGNFLSDCESVQQGLADNNYSRNNLGQIIDDYNACIMEKTKLLQSGKPTINLDPEKTELITSLISDISKSETLEDKESVLEMLNDLDTKIKKGAAIPGYLKTALRTSLKKDNQLSEQLSKILE